MQDGEDILWCDDCHAPIIAMPLWERVLSKVCWFLCMHWPHRWFANRAHLAILPWAGNVAYRCWCRRALTKATDTESGR